jgi:hypothetical protein
MAISWVSALRLYAKQTGHYILPKKGSEAYNAVKKIQAETADGPEHSVAKRGEGKRAMAKKAKMAKVAPVPEPASAPGIVAGVKKRGGKKAPTGAGGASEVTTREGDALLPPKAKLTQIDNQGVTQKAKKVVEPEAHPEKKVGRKGISRSGVTVSAEVTEDIVNRNTGPGGVSNARLADQKEELKGQLKSAKRTPKVVLVGEGQDKTIDGLKSDDPAGISGKAPFSITALRSKLLC